MRGNFICENVGHDDDDVVHDCCNDGLGAGPSGSVNATEFMGGDKVLVVTVAMKDERRREKDRYGK